MSPGECRYETPAFSKWTSSALGPTSERGQGGLRQVDVRRDLAAI